MLLCLVGWQRFCWVQRPIKSISEKKGGQSLNVEVVGTYDNQDDQQENLNKLSNKEEAIIRLLSNKTAVEPESVKQLKQSALLPSMKFAIGMPDLHPGKGFPIGAAMASEGLFYPPLVGTDIGCG